MKSNDNALKSIANLDQGIHNPARLMIVYLLSRSRTMDYLKLMRLTQLTSGNISTHLQKLEQAGYIVIEKSFVGRKPNTRIRLTTAGRRAYQTWGESVLCALPDSLARSLLDTRAQIAISGINRLLCLREFVGSLPDWQFPCRTTDYFIRGLIQPPLDETAAW